MIKRFVTILAAFAIVASAGCRDTDEGDYVRLAGNVFIFNYRIAVSTYVITLQRLRPIPEGAHVRATFQNPAGGEPQVVERPIFPGNGNIAVESDPVFCIKKGVPYTYTIEIISNGMPIETISGDMKSTLSQDVMPEKPLVLGPAYDRNPEMFDNNNKIRNSNLDKICN